MLQSAVLYKHSGEVIQVTPKKGKVFDEGRTSGNGRRIY